MMLVSNKAILPVGQSFFTRKHRGHLLLLGLMLFAGCSTTSRAADGDWPGWKGPARDGKSTDTGLLKQWPAGGPKLLWKISGVGKGFSSVAVSGGMIYTAGDIGDSMIISAYDMNGNQQWTAQHDAAWSQSPPGARSTPTIDGGNLYILSAYGLVGCYDAKTGARKWTRQMREFGGRMPNWGYAESVLILGDLAIVTPGGDHCIVALDKNTGETVWTTSGWRAAAQYSSCYAFNQQGMSMIVNGTGEGIACVSPTDGRLLWYNTFSAHNSANCPTPVYSDGCVFWANGYGKGGICLKVRVSSGRASATEAWQSPDMDCHHGGYIIQDGYIYGNNRNGWACLNLKTGQRMWEDRGVGKGSLCYANGMLYLFGENGGQIALVTCTPQGFDLKGSFRVEGKGPSWAHPVVTGGRLYLRYDDNLYCYDVKAK